jgi:hypothetical protein
MQAILGGRRVAPKGWPRVRVRVLVPLAVLVMCVAACGGGGSDDERATASANGEASRVAVLEVRSSTAHEALLLDAAQERGAPGDNEGVRYRIRSSDPGAAQAAVEALRANGFTDVELE